ncbi:hypothetical protein Hanom_Chr00s121556g01811841 [Helianthus anomalus]
MVMIVKVLTRNKLGGSLMRKRVKRSAYGKKSVAWMQGKRRLHPFVEYALFCKLQMRLV